MFKLTLHTASKTAMTKNASILTFLYSPLSLYPTMLTYCDEFVPTSLNPTLTLVTGIKTYV
jgi:hypothetical protein